MKNLIAFFTLVIFALIGCQKDETKTSQQSSTGKVTFYMTPSSGSWSLLIDGVDYGVLRQTSQAPVCGDVDFFSLDLSVGTHTSDLKSLSGYAWGSPKNFTVVSGCTSYKVPN